MLTLLGSLKFNSNSGYTLVELMAVVAIIGLMSVVSISSYNSTKKKTVLERATQQLLVDLRYVQNMAINTTKFNGQVPAGGYGIRINSATTYIIFADCDSSRDYSGASLECNGNTISEKFPNSLAPDKRLEGGVQMNSSDLDIVFLPPNPKVFVDGVANVALTTITLSIGTLSREVKINGITGQVTAN